MNDYCPKCDCGNPTLFYKDSKCRQCRNAAASAARKEARALAKGPDRYRREQARSQARYALRLGRIKREPCRQCGARAEMHHEDYSKPLEVEWLCRACHSEAHVSERFHRMIRETSLSVVASGEVE